MPPSVAQWLRIAAVVAIQIAALAVMWQTEYGAYGMALYLLAWITLNCIFLVVLRRPGIAAALVLTLFAALIVLSLFKFSVTWMTLGFLDFLIVDGEDTAHRGCRADDSGGGADLVGRSVSRSAHGGGSGGRCHSRGPVGDVVCRAGGPD
jgi:hypothetical protein